jgi:hypothetical protein
MYPLHYLCCEVEDVMSPFSLHTELDPPHAPRHPRYPRLLQHRHIHCRLVPPECRQLFQFFNPYPGSSLGLFPCFTLSYQLQALRRISTVG